MWAWQGWAGVSGSGDGLDKARRRSQTGAGGWVFPSTEVRAVTQDHTWHVPGPAAWPTRPRALLVCLLGGLDSVLQPGRAWLVSSVWGGWQDPLPTCIPSVGGAPGPVGTPESAWERGCLSCASWPAPPATHLRCSLGLRQRVVHHRPRLAGLERPALGCGSRRSRHLTALVSMI